MSDIKPTLKTLYEEFIQLEQDLSLFALKIADVFFWERIRFHAFQRLYYNIVVYERGSNIHQDEKPLLKNYFAKSFNYLKSIFFAQF